MDSNPISIPNLCGWCGGAATCRCGRCHGVYYCSNDHQTQHWAVHKKTCKKSSPPEMPLSNMIHNIPSTSNVGHSMPSTSNIIPNMPSASSISHNIPSTSISLNIPSTSNISLNMPMSNISHNMPVSNISCNMPVSSISHNMSSLNISHNLPSSNISHNLPSSNISHNLPSPNISHNLPSNTNHNAPSNINIPSTSNLSFLITANWNQSNVSTHINEDINNLPSYSNVFNTNNSCISSIKPLDFNIACADEILSSLSNDLLSSDNSFWNLIDTCDTQNVSDLDLYLGKDATTQVSASQHQSTTSNISTTDSPNLINDPDVNLIECASLSDICKNVIHDLNTYGICVLDKFIGSRRGNSVLDEVKSLYSTGVFEKGKLVKTSAYIASESIRSDVTTWVDGTEPFCPNIGYLIQKLDLVMATCNKMPNNGQLSKYKLHRRTKAMVACYPGNGTHYKKHVDNPNKDGRCITCIYYLNQNWDVKKHGGMLRMFPSARDSDVAQIAPIFDRMLFFWSDRRNPHEVLPALAIRFAITVWYFDADEREAALKAVQEKSQPPQSS